MKLLKEKDGVFIFEEDGKKYAVGAETKEQAEQILANAEAEKATKEANRDYKAELREKLTFEITAQAKEILAETDEAFLLHIEEKELGSRTSLTDKKYTDLLESRAATRTKAIELIASLDELKAIGKLEKFEIIF